MNAAAMAPKAPTETMIMVPIPRFDFSMFSLTKVIPAPNSPANPIPAISSNEA